jgi:DNA-binding NtrC family response regulator
MTTEPSAAYDVSVLVVDDDSTCLQLFETILEEEGYRVTTATRPSAALGRMRTEMPDVLVTDLRMPEMDGVELVRAAHALASDTYCVIVTGFASDEIVAGAYRAGVRGFLLKPVNVAEVGVHMRTAAEVVRLRRAVRALRAAQDARHGDGGVARPASRAGELADLTALPGLAGPVGLAGWDDTLGRLKRLATLRRQGLIGAAEFEEKKRLLLDRL